MQAPIPGTDLSLFTWLVISGGQPVMTRTSKEGHVIGDFGTESLLLCADLAKTIVEAAEAVLPRDLWSMTIVSKMFHWGDGKAGLGVAILSSVPAPDDFHRVAKDVLSRVSPTEHHVASRDGSSTQVHADQFLGRHGGKSIPTALVATFGTHQTELCGRLPSQAQRPEIKKETVTVEGKPDGIIKKRRALFIDTHSGKLLSCKFDEAEFFESLFEALRDGKTHRFTMAVENDGTDKPELVLKKFELLNDGWAF